MVLLIYTLILEENIMFNFFKKNTEQASNKETPQPEQFTNADNADSAVKTEKKKVHGQDGVCCGSCGGE